MRNTGDVTEQTTAPDLATLGVPSRAEQLRSAVFAAVFAPIALLALGFSATALFNESIYGMPLASAEGVVGMLIAGILLCLIALNCEDSATGMYVTAGWAAVIAVLQYTGTVPFGNRFPDYATDTQYSLGWAAYPIAIVAIALGTALACDATRKRVSAHFKETMGKNPSVDVEDESESSGLLLGREEMPDRTRAHTTGAVASSLACSAAALAIIDVAPTHSRLVALEGLSGLGGQIAPAPFGVLAAVILGVVAWGSTYSVLGTQIASWVVMITPFYLVIPLWATLTGHVSSPDATWETALAISSPIITSLGVVLFSLTTASHWTRRGIIARAHAHEAAVQRRKVRSALADAEAGDGEGSDGTGGSGEEAGGNTQVGDRATEML